MTVASLRVTRAALEEAVEAVAPEPRSETIEIVGAHLIDRKDDDEAGPLRRGEVQREEEENDPGAGGAEAHRSARE